MKFSRFFFGGNAGALACKRSKNACDRGNIQPCQIPSAVTPQKTLALWARAPAFPGLELQTQRFTSAKHHLER